MPTLDIRYGTSFVDRDGLRCTRSVCWGLLTRCLFGGTCLVASRVVPHDDSLYASYFAAEGELDPLGLAAEPCKCEWLPRYIVIRGSCEPKGRAKWDKWPDSPPDIGWLSSVTGGIWALPGTALGGPASWYLKCEWERVGDWYESRTKWQAYHRKMTVITWQTKYCDGVHAGEIRNRKVTSMRITKGCQKQAVDCETRYCSQKQKPTVKYDLGSADPLDAFTAGLHFSKGDMAAACEQALQMEYQGITESDLE